MILRRPCRAVDFRSWRQQLKSLATNSLKDGTTRRLFYFNTFSTHSTLAFVLDPSNLGIVVTDASVQSVSFRFAKMNI